MGKGFQNFMSKKDFHPSAWWNLKKVWEARELKSQKEKREEEMRVQYEKEQEMLNNKALLGDEKAKMGLSFMYDAPAGMAKREEPKEEPKFEWQRKYQAPREEWAKNNELIQDQPFGIQVKNVRCCRCHKWGHINTDNECPLYGMSGNFEDAGYANNPSDLIKEYRKEKSSHGPSSAKRDRLDEEEWVDKEQLAEDMKESYSLRLKGHVLNGIREDQQLSSLKGPTSEADEKIKFLASLSDKQKKKMLKKLLGGASEKKSKKDKKKEKKAKKSAKLQKVKKEVESESSESEGEPSVKRGRHESISDDKKSGRDRPSERVQNDREQNKRRRHDSDSSVEVTTRRQSPDKERRTHKSHDTSGYDARKVKIEPESDASDNESKNATSSSSRKRISSDDDVSNRKTERDRKERVVPREKSDREHRERRGSRDRQAAKSRDEDRRRERRESSADRRDRRRSRSPRDDRRRQRRSRSRS